MRALGLGIVVLLLGTAQAAPSASLLRLDVEGVAIVFGPPLLLRIQVEAQLERYLNVYDGVGNATLTLGERKTEIPLSVQAEHALGNDAHFHVIASGERYGCILLLRAEHAWRESDYEGAAVAFGACSGQGTWDGVGTSRAELHHPE